MSDCQTCLNGKPHDLSEGFFVDYDVLKKGQIVLILSFFNGSDTSKWLRNPI